MRNKSKALLLMLCAVLLIATSVLGTFAYLTDTEGVTNTFTVGQVGLVLDEADTDNSKEGVTTEGRDKANKYHLLPGHTYVKDPTVTVDTGSEDSYIRMMVKVENIGQLKQALPDAKYYNDGVFLLQELCVDENGNSTWDGTKWEFEKFHDANDAKYPDTYEFRYYATANDQSGLDGDGILEPLFTKITVPGEIDGTHLAYLADVEIVVTAHAIQAAGFENDEDGAWAAFDGQVKP